MPNHIYNAIKPIYYLSRICLVWPYKYTKTGQISHLSRKNRISGLVSAAAFVGAFFWALDQRQIMSTQIRVVLGTTAEVIFTIFQHLLVIPTMIISNSGRCDLTIKHFYSKLTCVDILGLLSKNEIFLNMDRSIMWQVIVRVGAYTLINLLDIITYVWEEGYDSLKLYLSANIALIMEVAIISQIDCEVQLLRRYFQNLNMKLETSAAFALSHSKPRTCINNRLLHFECRPKHLREIFKIHARLCDLIENINDNHGWKFIVIVGNVVWSTVGSLYFCFVAVVDQKYQRETEPALAALSIAGDTSNIVFHWVLFLGLLRNCSSTIGEAFKTGIIASNVLLEMETENCTESLKSYKEQLQNAVLRTSLKTPHFSAAGIFNVDLATISIVTGAVTSYFIVFLQFKGSLPLYSKTNGSRFD